MEEGVPLPAIIEVSNSGVCNRECSFCPRSDPNYNHVNEFFQMNFTTNYVMNFRVTISVAYLHIVDLMSH